MCSMASSKCLVWHQSARGRRVASYPLPSGGMLSMSITVLTTVGAAQMQCLSDNNNKHHPPIHSPVFEANTLVPNSCNPVSCMWSFVHMLHSISPDTVKAMIRK